VTTPSGFRVEGFWIDAGVSSHTDRSVQPQERDLAQKQLMYRLARCVNSVAFLPLALRQGTHERLFGCKRAKELPFFSFCRTKNGNDSGYLLLLPAFSAFFIQVCHSTFNNAIIDILVSETIERVTWRKASLHAMYFRKDLSDSGTHIKYK